MPHLDKNSLLYPLAVLKKIRDNFVKELFEALSGKETSLVFFKNHLPKKSLIKQEEIFQVMVIGGRMFKSARVKVNLDNSCHDRRTLSQNRNSLIKILKIEEKPLPIFKTGRDFFEFFEKQLETNVKIIALNFAFPLVPSLRGRFLDGTLIKGTKEHQFQGLTGKKIGEKLKKYIFLKQKRKIKVAVANDTICLLMAGLGLEPSRQRPYQRWSQTVAGVVGAGNNFAFFWTRQRRLI